MPWAAPSLIGASPAYGGTWQPGVHPHTGAPGPLLPRAPQHAYHAALIHAPYGAPYGTPTYADASFYPAPPQPLQQSALLPMPPSPSTPSWDQAAFL
jgi:hypothetical protein